MTPAAQISRFGHEGGWSSDRRGRRLSVESRRDDTSGGADADLQAFADSIAKLPAPKAADGGDAQRLAHGKATAEQNHCLICHQSNLSGRDNVPRLAGQREEYALKSLREYKSGARHGYDTSMADVVQPMADADFIDLAYYIAGVK